MPMWRAFQFGTQDDDGGGDNGVDNNSSLAKKGFLWAPLLHYYIVLAVQAVVGVDGWSS